MIASREPARCCKHGRLRTWSAARKLSDPSGRGDSVSAAETVLVFDLCVPHDLVAARAVVGGVEVVLEAYLGSDLLEGVIDVAPVGPGPLRGRLSP